VLLVLLLLLAGGCASSETRTVVRYSGSAVGAEGRVLEVQIARFEALHPGVHVEVVATPDAADQRHQLYVQWLGAASAVPDVLQLDVVWTPELAAAGWLLPVEIADEDAFLPAAIEADRWNGQLYAVPLFVDTGVLYWRTDLVDHAPATFEEMEQMARARSVRYGIVWQGARYEGLICVFLERLAAAGGSLLDLDAAPARAALRSLRAELASGIAPRAALAWQEEQTRFAFQNGDAVFMRNWPYAYPLLQDAAESKVAGKVGVAPLPAAALGGAHLAVNARSAHPELARELVAYLTAPAQMIERAQLAGQYPARPALYTSGELEGALPIPPRDALAVIERATARPATPVYAELSAAVQVHLHRALDDQVSVDEALRGAATDVRAILRSADEAPRPRGVWVIVAVLGGVGLLVGGLAAHALRRPPPDAGPGEERTGWLLVAPAVVVIAVVALFPLLWTAWESLHDHDLRMPWRGRPFVGAANYAAIAEDDRFWTALAHTLAFTFITVILELVLGLALALVLHRSRAVRSLAILPWALPTVVAALLWRFLFEDPDGGMLVDSTLAWVPIILADVWKTTPFVALLLLAGLQNIDPHLYDAARTDGAGPWQQLRHVTLPLLRPTILVVLVFRSLDAFRVFDLVYVMTGGGPGTATEPVSLLSFTTLLRDLRFGRGAAIALVIFVLTLLLALLYTRLLRDEEPS
jgi:ABC-type sugar transport system permease subunit/ABC-type glycerol-3-phosphate transport system substrate-binding protein